MVVGCGRLIVFLVRILSRFSIVMVFGLVVWLLIVLGLMGRMWLMIVLLCLCSWMRLMILFVGRCGLMVDGVLGVWVGDFGGCLGCGCCCFCFSVGCSSGWG